MITFADLKKKITDNCEQKTIAVASAEDHEVLEALKAACDLKLAKAILIGHEEKIKEIAETIHFDLSGVTVINEPDHKRAARQAVAKVRQGEAQLVMKGLITTAELIKEVLDKERGLRTGNILSHVAVFQVPKIARMLLVTDCALNIAPNLQEKIQIVQNAAVVAKRIGIDQPKAAAVCAIETVNPNMQATVEAALLAKMGDRGQIEDVLIDGPLALDNAISPESARHKGIVSPVAGEAHIILVPDIEAGNVMYKTLVYLADTSNAGVVMGAQVPIVLTSRADSAETKLNSIALSLVIAQ